MPIRDLDPDNDYHYDKTNRGHAPHRKSSLVQELEARARACRAFQPHPNELLYGVCVTCTGPKYAHTATALRNRKLI